jgi:PAS domain S-box-containing protein
MTDRRPVQVRLAIAALAVLVGLVAILGTWQVVAARSTQREEILTGEASAARLAASALGSALASRLGTLSNLADQPQSASLFSPSQASRLSSVVVALHQLYPGYSSFDVIGGNGRLLARWPSDPPAIGRDLSHQSFFEAVLRTKAPGVTQGMQQTGAPRELVVGLDAPVHDASGSIVGVLQATIAAPELGTMIGGTTLGSGGGLAIVDQDARLLSGPSASAATSYKSVPAVSGALAGTSGSGSGPVPGFAGTRLYGYAPVPSTGWAVIAEEPETQLDGPIGAITDRLIVIGLIVLLLAVATGLLVGQLVRRLAREHEHAGAVLSSVGEGVATIDTSGTLLRLNPALERLTGHSAAEVQGREWSAALPLYDRHGNAVAPEESVLAGALDERRVVATSGYGLYVGTKEGRRIPIALTASPLLAGGELEGAVVVVRDISQEREVDQLKTSLVSTVSHELRTPLTMIQGFSELLLMREDMGAEQSREALAQIHTSSQRLGRLIDDLLSVSRIESGKLTAELGPVPLGDVMSEVIAAFAPQADARLTTELDPALAPVLADRDKTIQVVTNLVSNALRYSTDSSSVRLVARSVGDHAEISVADQGIGMTETECAHVFDKFVRMDHPEVRRVSGTGLGLYIAKNLVEMQHGQLWVNSTVGKGSTFTFSLPFAPLQANGAVAAERQAET